ncbi:MAG: tRNA (N6-threonylcarbamoyladenosine(37)-N6)-methyltransferase TrmO [Clostridia bacterium]|nr:tRNA (N6-threonylcarbamoyladenosine(37)-N6)-methyltransferase TrmO [Clostridia bacterium]MBQ7047631.1 tRNA (N6-threonylcarbamoyladenosine(37)-N6)-methyltransferase TrmO [Clostridia bacterium]
MEHLLKVIGHIHTDFPTKFGIPRQSGLVEELEGRIVFLPEYGRSEAFRGLEGFSHIWLIWQFSEAVRDTWSPTVRPPRLGGNKRQGVFATRSPFRPNPIGLSCVKLLGIENDKSSGTVLRIAGADLMDGTPIYDIKPYLPFADSHPNALGGFAEEKFDYCLKVVFPDELREAVPSDKIKALEKLLSGDPRPSYKEDGDRVYGFFFGDMEVMFKVADGVLTVTDIKKHL